MRKERSYSFPGVPFVRAFLTASGTSRIAPGDGDDSEIRLRYRFRVYIDLIGLSTFGCDHKSSILNV